MQEAGGTRARGKRQEAGGTRARGKRQEAGNKDRKLEINEKDGFKLNK